MTSGQCLSAAYLPKQTVGTESLWAPLSKFPYFLLAYIRRSGAHKSLWWLAIPPLQPTLSRRSRRVPVVCSTGGSPAELLHLCSSRLIFHRDILHLGNSNNTLATLAPSNAFRAVDRLILQLLLSYKIYLKFGLPVPRTSSADDDDTETMENLFARDLPSWPLGDNKTDTVIQGVHYNVTTLNHWNYTLYEGNWTLSNWSWCFLMDKPYTPPLLLENGTFGMSERARLPAVTCQLTSVRGSK